MNYLFGLICILISPLFLAPYVLYRLLRVMFMGTDNKIVMKRRRRQY